MNTFTLFSISLLGRNRKGFVVKGTAAKNRMTSIRGLLKQEPHH